MWTKVNKYEEQRHIYDLVKHLELSCENSFFVKIVNGWSLGSKKGTTASTLLSYTYFFISNQGQASALKVAYTFMISGAQSCLMVAQQFDQVNYVRE